MKKRIISVFLSFCVMVSCMVGLSVTASARTPITYIGADGSPVTIGSYTIVTTDNLSWCDTMVVPPNETVIIVDEEIMFSDNTNLILCDGAELIIGSDGFIYNCLYPSTFDKFTLNIFGQSKQSGKMVVKTSKTAISAGDLNVYGGVVSVSGEYGILCENNLNVAGGKVTANSSDYDAISCSGSFSVSGGDVKANANGQKGNGIYSRLDVSISDGKVEAYGSNADLLTDKSISITGGELKNIDNIKTSGAVNVRNATLKNITLGGTDTNTITGSDISDCTLSNATITDSAVTYSTITDSTVSDSELTRSTLKNAVVKHSTFDTDTIDDGAFDKNGKSFTRVEAVEPTSTTTGTKEHFVDSDGKKYVKTPSGDFSRVYDKDLVIKKLQNSSDSGGKTDTAYRTKTQKPKVTQNVSKLNIKQGKSKTINVLKLVTIKGLKEDPEITFSIKLPKGLKGSINNRMLNITGNKKGTYEIKIIYHIAATNNYKAKNIEKTLKVAIK